LLGVSIEVAVFLGVVFGNQAKEACDGFMFGRLLRLCLQGAGLGASFVCVVIKMGKWKLKTTTPKAMDVRACH